MGSPSPVLRTGRASYDGRRRSKLRPGRMASVLSGSPSRARVRGCSGRRGRLWVDASAAGGAAGGAADGAGGGAGVAETVVGWRDAVCNRGARRVAQRREGGWDGPAGASLRTKRPAKRLRPSPPWLTLSGTIGATPREGGAAPGRSHRERQVLERRRRCSPVERGDRHRRRLRAAAAQVVERLNAEPELGGQAFLLFQDPGIAADQRVWWS